MARMKINYKLIIVLIIGLALLAGSAIGLRKWFRSKTVTGGYTEGKKAFEKGQWAKAADELGNYLAVRKDDVEILKMYAEAQMNIRPMKQGNIQQAVSAYRQVNRLDPNDLEVANEICSIYFSMGAYNEVRAKAEDFLENNDDPEIRMMLGRSLIGLRMFEDAYREITKLTVDHPDFIPAYELLAVYATRRPDVFKKEPIFWYEQALKRNPNSPMAHIIRAAWYRLKGEQQNALKDLAIAENMMTDSTDVIVRMAQEYILLKQYDKAKGILDEIEKTESDNLNLWRAKTLIAIASKDPNQITQTADLAMEKLGYKNWDFLELAAELYITAENYEKANQAIDRLETLEENRAKILFYRGLIQQQKGNQKDAAKMVREAVDLGYKTPRARITLASAYSETGDLSSGIAQLRSLVNEIPDNFDAHYNLAKLLLQNNDPAGAAEHAQQAMQINPANSEVVMLYVKAKSLALSRAGVSQDHPEWKLLEDKISEYESSFGKEGDIIVNKFRLALRRGNKDEAQSLLQQIRQKDPNSIENYIAQSEMMLYEDKTEQAKILLEKAIETHPKMGEPYSYMLQILFSENNIERAIQVAAMGLENIQSENSKLQIALVIADITRNTEKEDRVLTLLDNAQKQFPDSIALKRKILSFEKIHNDPNVTLKLIDDIKEIEGENGWQWKYEKAKHLYLSGQMGDGSEILEILKDAITINPASLEIRVLMATIHSEKGDYMAAASIYKQALDRWPNEPGVIVPLISIYYKLNEYDKADQLMQNAMELDIQHPVFQRLQVHSLIRSGDTKQVSDMLETMMTKNPNDNDIKLSLAMIYIRESNFEKAQSLIDQLLQKDHGIAVDIAQIQLYNRMGDGEAALRKATELVDTYQNAEAYLTRGRNFLAVKKDDLAEKDFIKAKQLEPENEEAWMVLIDFYNRKGNVEKSREIAKAAIEKLPENIEILKRAIVLFGASNNTDDAELAAELIEKGLELNPSDVDLKLIKARYLISTQNPGKIEQAVGILESLVEEYPAIKDGWELLANISLQKNNTQRALYYCDKGLTFSPNDGNLQLLKARTILESSPFSAVRILNGLLQENPDSVEVIIPLAQAHIITGNTPEAIQMLKSKLETAQNENKRRLKMMLATAYYKDNQTEQAQKLFDELAKHSDDEILLYTRATLLMDKKQWAPLIDLTSTWAARNQDKIELCLNIARQLVVQADINARKAAEDLLKRLLALDTDNVDTLSNLGIVYQMNGKPEQSSRMYEEILKVQPNNIVAINNLSWILCENSGEFNKALELTSKGLEIAPNYEDLYDTRGYIYYRTGKFDKAIADFQNALKLIPPGNPQAAGVYFHLGQTYEEMGDSSKASENLKRALTIDSDGEVLSAEDISTIRRLLYKLGNGNQ